MAVRKLDFKVADSRKNVTMRNDPTLIDTKKLKLGNSTARHDRGHCCSLLMSLTICRPLRRSSISPARSKRGA